MKTIIGKLLPGVLATLAAFAFGAFCLVRAQNKTVSPGDGSPASVPAPAYSQEQAPVYAAAPQARQILVCGVCGAELQQPQAVMVAQPVRGGYRTRPQAYATDAYYANPEPAPCAEPIAYAPAYYGRTVSVDPFEPVRVNPIPFPGQVRAIYQPTPGVQYRQYHGGH